MYICTNVSKWGSIWFTSNLIHKSDCLRWHLSIHSCFKDQSSFPNYFHVVLKLRIDNRTSSSGSVIDIPLLCCSLTAYNYSLKKEKKTDIAFKCVSSWLYLCGMWTNYTHQNCEWKPLTDTSTAKELQNRTHFKVFCKWVRHHVKTLGLSCLS